jgi:tetratricopeptide (TPR) repeat protein
MEDVIKWLKLAVAKSPDEGAYQALAEIYRHQGKEDLWIATLDEFLTRPDYGLSHASVRTTIARRFMQLKQWQRATAYADEAAGSYSAFGLSIAAECHEALQDWDTAEKILKACDERYEGLEVFQWYLFCRRTGHGDLEGARKAVRARLKASPRLEYALHAAFYKVLEKDFAKPREFLAVTLKTRAKPAFGLHAVLLSDQMGDSAARDRTLSDLKQYRNPSVHAALRNDPKGSKDPTTGGKVASLAPGTISPTDAIVGLAELFAADLKRGGKGNIDLALADRLCAAAMEDTLPLLPCTPEDTFLRNPRVVFNYFLGRYLDLHGKPDLAIKYWKKCMGETERINEFHRTLAAAALMEHGIKPESYRELYDPDWKTRKDEPKKEKALPID